tara:strand:- start:2789 stop:3901 length:1113 start_codon:yes stop_codon:yes gene_type:complete
MAEYNVPSDRENDVEKLLIEYVKGNENFTNAWFKSKREGSSLKGRLGLKFLEDGTLDLGFEKENPSGQKKYDFNVGKNFGDYFGSVGAEKVMPPHGKPKNTYRAELKRKFLNNRGEASIGASTSGGNKEGYARLKLKFDEGGFVELPTDIEKQLVSVEHNPGSWKTGEFEEKELNVDIMDILPESVLDLRVKTEKFGDKTLRDLGVKYYSELSRLGGQAFKGGQKKWDKDYLGTDSIDLGRYNDPDVTWMAGEIQKSLPNKFGRVTAQNDKFHHGSYYDDRKKAGKPPSRHLRGTKLDFTYKTNKVKDYKKYTKDLIKKLKNNYGLEENKDYLITKDFEHGTGIHVDIGFTDNGLKKINTMRWAAARKNK